MLPSEYEKLVIGTCLAHPNGTENVPQRVTYELDNSRMSSPAHVYIFDAIKRCVVDGVVPNPANVAVELKDKLDTAGGLEYLDSLQRFPSLVGAFDTSGLPNWVNAVDILGRARLIYTVLSKRVGMSLDDFQQLVLNSPDPDQYLADLITEINRYVIGGKSDYKPFSEAVELFEERVRASMRGEVTDILPCGIPNLEKYQIPRPRSFGVISGISGQGKTQFAIYMGVGAAIQLDNTKQKGEVSINTFEQQGERLAMRTACMMTGINSIDIAQARLTTSQADKLFAQCDYIKSLPIVYNDDPSLTSSQFVTHAISRSLKNPRVMGISDYVELFKDSATSEELRISQATRNVRGVCWETGSCEVMVVQVNDKAVNSEYKTGGMFASRYSRAPSQAADWYIEILNYPQLRRAQLSVTVPDGRDENLAYALIEKNKDYPVGEEPFSWIPEYTQFRDISLPLGVLYREHSNRQDDF